MYESTGWSTHANSGAIYLESAPICVTFKSLPDIKSSVWLQENWSRIGNPAGLVDSVADVFVGATCCGAPIGSMSRLEPPQQHQPGHWTPTDLARFGLRPRKLRAKGQRCITRVGAWGEALPPESETDARRSQPNRFSISTFGPYREDGLRVGEYREGIQLRRANTQHKDRL